MCCNLPSKSLVFFSQETGNKEPDDSRTFQVTTCIEGKRQGVHCVQSHSDTCFCYTDS